MKDSVGRLTPYELAFGGARFSEDVFPAIAEDARRCGADPWRRVEFTRLESVAALLEEVLPEGDDAAAVDQYLHTLYHAYHFWSAGCPIYAFGASVLRALVESPPDLSGWRFRAPRPALYIELARNLFWAEVSGGAPEPVEGLHLVCEGGRGSSEIELLLVLGMRAERPGFSVAGVSFDPGRLPAVAGAETFRSDIPGAELAGLYSLRKISEAAALALRSLWYIDANPARLERVRGAEAGRETPGHSVPTSLDHVRVSSVERSGE